MCRIDERAYVRSDGHESVFQDNVLCEKGRQRGRMCSDARVRRTEYPDPTSSPIASSPLTPSANTRPRRPSTSGRPSTREGPITSLTPEIHIELGSKKGKGKGYISITTGKSKRLSTSSTSGSDASHTVRTGYPNISPPPLDSGYGVLRPGYSQRNPSSDESFASSSRGYRPSDDYDTPSLVTTTTEASSGNHPIIHNNARQRVSKIDTTRGPSDSLPSPYRLTEFAPRDVSYAPEITGRDEDRQRRRDEQKKRQEAADREAAVNKAREENLKKVRFETDRATHRAEKRGENNFAAHEKRRAEDRERLQGPCK
ncbi:hypothetical protein OPT61_g9755 [Boeremia exigua]|uniref:Uncharacterized protein n=1 Tax=Boeremia exigua TaxID=749465 RepID=A0ACC2HTD7_9PLEO|nr:hypothetical protein OPT61_g9755 [Boeremia exigua]